MGRPLPSSRPGTSLNRECGVGRCGFGIERPDRRHDRLDVWRCRVSAPRGTNHWGFGRRVTTRTFSTSASATTTSVGRSIDPPGPNERALARPPLTPPDTPDDHATPELPLPILEGPLPPPIIMIEAVTL